MKIVYSGLESSGKSLKLAKVVKRLVLRNAKWAKKSGIVRPIISNLHFNPLFEDFAKSYDIPLLYWTHLSELIDYENVDVVIDELGNYFDSRGWESLTLDVRRWLTQGAKCGIEIYGSAQDFAQVDKAFRRLTNQLYQITKIVGSPRPSATRPPVKRIWGLCVIREIEPMGYDEEKSKFKPKDIIPGFFTINREDCEIFNTNQKILKSKPIPYKHEERSCELEGCSYCRTNHF